MLGGQIWSQIQKNPFKNWQQTLNVRTVTCVVGIAEVDSLVHLHEEHLTYDHKTSDADCDADQEAHELMSNEANSMEEPALFADLELHFPDDSDTDDSDFEREQDQVECPDLNQKDEIGRFYTTDD